jgi:hypothetical protein
MGAVGFKADAQNEKRQISAVKVRLQQKGSRTAEVDALTSHVSVQTGVTGQQEPFVDAKAVAAFLSIGRDDVLRLTREGKIRG